jgi:hypothetical protein
MTGAVLNELAVKAYGAADPGEPLQPITEVNTVEEIHLLTASDPVMKSGLNLTFETYPMLNIVRAR